MNADTGPDPGAGPAPRGPRPVPATGSGPENRLEDKPVNTPEHGPESAVADPAAAAGTDPGVTDPSADADPACRTAAQGSTAVPVTGSGFAAFAAGAEREAAEHRAVHSEGHGELRSRLGAWAVHACSGEEKDAVESHVARCGPCAREARRLRDSVQWLSPPDPLDLDASLRARVFESCLGSRPPQVPVPHWLAPYAAETFRLDALLGSLSPGEWETSVALTWHGGDRELPVADVLAHLGAIDGLVGTALDLPDPLGPGAPRGLLARTSTALDHAHSRTPEAVRDKWRSQTHALVRTAAVAGDAAHAMAVDYGGAFKLCLRDAFLDRAFACWMHADDIARAVVYPHVAPGPEHLRAMIDFIARMLPLAVAGRRRRGLAVSAARLVEAGAPGRSIHVQIEGPGGGDWYVAVDSPDAAASAEESVAHIVLDGTEFCQLAAGHRDPHELAVGVRGDAAVAQDALFATAALSRQ